MGRCKRVGAESQKHINHCPKRDSGLMIFKQCRYYGIDAELIERAKMLDRDASSFNCQIDPMVGPVGFEPTTSAESLVYGYLHALPNFLIP